MELGWINQDVGYGGGIGFSCRGLTFHRLIGETDFNQVSPVQVYREAEVQHNPVSVEVGLFKQGLEEFTLAVDIGLIE